MFTTRRRAQPKPFSLSCAVALCEMLGVVVTAVAEPVDRRARLSFLRIVLRRSIHGPPARQSARFLHTRVTQGGEAVRLNDQAFALINELLNHDGPPSIEIMFDDGVWMLADQ